MKYHLLLGLLLSLLPATLHAQALQGAVASASGTPLGGVNVAVLNTPFGTVTDDDGLFVLTLQAGTYTLSFTAIGYAPQLVTVATPAQGALTVTLVPRTEALGELVVSTQRTDAALLDAPAAVTTLDADEIVTSQTWSLADLTGRVPGYLYQELGVGFQALQSIRGVQVFSENPAVATYVDGVNALDILAGGLALVDVERVEVLRGPQGTLFGRNALGGVVNIVTRPPTNRREVFGEATVGNLGLQRYAAGVKAPLVPGRLFVGATALFQDRAGYFENDTTGLALFAPSGDVVGEEVGGEQTLYAQVGLQWLPSEVVRARLDVKVQRDQSDASGFFAGAPDEATAFANPDALFLARIGEHERTLFNGAFALDIYGPGLTLALVTTLQRIGLSYADIFDGSGVYFSYDLDGSSADLGATPDPQVVFSQELRATSSGDGPLSFTAGVNVFSQNAFEPTTNLAVELGPDTYALFRNEGTNAGFAAFGQATLRLFDRLDVTGGLRYDVEDRQSTFNGFGDLVLQDGELTEFLADTTVSGAYSALSPKAALALDVTGNVRAYASYTRGFRAGGINAQRLPDRLEGAYEFAPEYSDNIELGLKARLGDRLYAAATGFLIAWTDLQFFNLVAPPFTFARENVGDARSQGIELEVAAVPFERLRLDATLSLTDTEYDGFVLQRLDPDTFQPISDDISGNRLANAPGRTAFFGAEWRQPVGGPIDGGAALVLRGEVRNVGGFFTDIQNDLRQDAYTVINARLGFETQRASAFFWIQNLTDERYLIYGAPDTSFNRRSVIAPPRTLGVTLRLRR
ncbi:MAG: TonB-dependent receptor [Bacteroidota bacterium]